MKNMMRGLGLLSLFLSSFVFFFYLTFPYEVLKEQLSAEIQQNAGGLTVRIGQLGPSLPLGLWASDVKVTSARGASSFSLKSVDLNIGILSLIIGQINLSTKILAQDGKLYADVNFPIFGLVSGSFVPSSLSLDAKSFPLEQFVDFGLNAAASAPGANSLAAPILSALGLRAQLNCSAELTLNTKVPTQSKGHLDLQLANAVLKLSHPTLGLPDQQLKKASIKAKVEEGSVIFDKSSQITSDELHFGTEGKITLKPNLGASLLDLRMVVKLDKGLKEKFGFFLDAFTGSSTQDGQLTMQLRGPLDSPAVTKL